MSSSAKDPPYYVVVAKLPENQTPFLLIRAREIVEGVAASSWFPSPEPSLAEIQAGIDDLHAAEVTTHSGLVGSVSERNAKRTRLVALIQRLAVYVSVIARANPEHAPAIAEAARMYLKRTGGRRVTVFGGEPGDHSGEIHVWAPPARNRSAAYEFQYSLDGGQTWLPFPQAVTTKASAKLTGLTPGTRVHLRYRVTVKGLTGNWSDGAIFVDVE